ncbi:RNA polymerase sigma factor [Taibaiella koreensis]|uniref:RNA polymerase sigma factor n=1 Tax=Taibaiella koreensis TaxID=1268548 RepID=UPI000E59C13A|nr:RNA polymerase sigma-70 factor [Taibaiella koreensis]
MSPAQIDLLLFDSVKAGDVHAFRILVEKYSLLLHAYCMKYIKNECDAEEIVADAFITLWDKKSRIDISSSLKAYLYATVRNHSINYLRTLKKAPLLESISEEAPLHGHRDAVIYPFEPSHEQRMTERMRLLEEALEQLPPARKKVFLMFRSGLKYGQIADQLNLSEKTVRNQIDRAIKQLREYISEALPLGNAFTLFLLTACTL